MANCDKCDNARITKTIEIGVWCRACAPGPDRIRVEGIEFQRTQRGTLELEVNVGTDDDWIVLPIEMSAAKARDLATFLIQNFCAPEDYQ